MFKPFSLLIAIVGLYLLFPVLGFGIFPEHFDFSDSLENFAILGAYIFIMLLSALAAKQVESIGHTHQSGASRNRMLEKWSSRSVESRALIFVAILSGISLTGMLIVITISGMFSPEFSPHELRMNIASSGNLVLTIIYNLTSLLILVTTNLTLLSIKKANKKTYFMCVLLINFLLIIATGQRSMIMLAICSYLLLQEFSNKRRLGIRALLTLLFGLAFVIFLGVVRQGDEFSYASVIWQASVRFDLFFPQFFNFLDVYRGLRDIGYGYFHFTFPLQIIPSSVFHSKPETFLHFINRDLMNIPEGTGNDFTAFAEFIYNYGIVLGLFFFSIFCFFMSFIIHRMYRLARNNPIYFALYFPIFLVYLSLVLLTGISNQAHIFAVAGLLLAVVPCKLFVSYTKFNKGNPAKLPPTVCKL